MITRIEITNYDGTVDRVISDERPKQTGLQTTEILTDNVYRRIDEYNYTNQRVQSVAFNKFTIMWLSTEDYGAELLRYAKHIEILAHNNTMIHDAVVLDVTREPQADTDFTLITLEYYDRNLNNYLFGEPPVINFLRSDAIKEQGSSLNTVNILRVNAPGKLWDWVTYLDIKKIANAAEAQSFTNSQSGATVTTNSIIKSKFELVFYLNSKDIIPFQEVLPLADGVKVKAWYFSLGQQYNIQEAPEVTVEKVDGWDLFKGTVNFVYQITNNYSYG